ncbi:MAG: hypothetical protein ACR2IL_10725 [Chitinophagaceae bacterium]
MYGYANEIFPYLAGLLNAGGDTAGQPTDLPGATLAKGNAAAPRDNRGLAQAGAGMMAASRRGQTPDQRRQAMSSVPLPPSRPNAQGPEMPQGLLGGNSAEDFLRSQGIGVAPQPTSGEFLPRIDNGPAPQSPQNPTWQMPQASNAPLPPQRPQMGPQMSDMSQPLHPALQAALANLPKGPTYMSAPGGAPTMRSNNPADNLPKGPTNLSAGPGGFGNGSSIMDQFLAQYLYGGR